ncbi:PSP1 C-terminal domain-containing protein [Mucilaginibacter flavidus]|uniref:PSP1 C-terminal domain-containing protein n=1 Tax=Mucilaginibacter flavidus TaxID=2949309 RepID=UPI0035149B4D
MTDDDHSIIHNMNTTVQFPHAIYAQMTPNQGDQTKATFYYTAEGRIDFRELILLLAKTFGVKIVSVRLVCWRKPVV